ALSKGQPIHEVQTVSAMSGLNYFKSHQTLHPFLSHTLKQLNLSDVLLIDPDGNVAYSVNKSINFGANVRISPFNNSRMTQIFRWSLNAPIGTTKFFDFAPASRLRKYPVAYLATPIFDKANFLGTLLYQIPIDRLDNLLSNQQHWDQLGLKKSGEIVVFGVDGYLRNNSRLFSENPDKFLKSYSRLPESSANLEQIKFARTTALNLGISQEQIKRYLLSDQLLEISNDYMGEKALQSIGTLTLPGNTQWILIAKMNVKESLVPFRENVLALSLAALFIISVAIGLTYWLARRLFDPLLNLSLGLAKLKENDFSTKLEIPEKGEFHPIFENFNALSENFLKTKATKDFLEQTFESIHEALFVVEVVQDSSEQKTLFQIRGINPYAAAMTGMARSALGGTDLQMWIETDFTKISSSLHEETQTSPPGPLDAVLKKITGERIPLELSWARIKIPHSSKVVLVLIGWDVRWKKKIEHELKLKENLLKESEALSKTGSFRWEIGTGKCLWSEQEFQLFGLDPETTLPTYDLFRSLIFKDDLALFDHTFQEAQKDIRPFNLDFRIKKKTTHEIVWIRAHGRMEYDSYGNALFMYGTTQDITEFRRAEQALISEKEDALRSSKAKSDFLAHMSHEIRTPMNAIMGMADLLKETKLDPEQQYYVTIFCKAGESLMSLINDILDFSKIEAGEVSIENIPFDLKKILNDVEEIMKPRALEKGLSYSFEINPGLTPFLMGDPTKLRQVLINLVSNSLKFTEHGYIKVTVGKNPSKKDSLMISISDSGVGIPTNKQHLIFQKFSQADTSITRRFGGTGLGLAISKSLIDLMGGQIWFKSREGLGTTFFFTIPYREQIYNPVTHRPLIMQKSELSFTPPKVRDPDKKIRILVADDTEDNRTLFTHYLKNGPYEIVEAENGLEAVNKVKSGQFDIVFMDVQMPEMDGYTATDSIRKWEVENHKEPTPIIALTAHALSEDRQKSLKSGCNDHIAKPFKKDTLVGVINKYSL
ncbi:MAG: response regulator, partial [Bdellovibrio sp.]|nr:response regulator [Bdellovibrio sp.]